MLRPITESKLSQLECIDLLYSLEMYLVQIVAKENTNGFQESSWTRPNGWSRVSSAHVWFRFSVLIVHLSCRQRDMPGERIVQL